MFWMVTDETWIWICMKPTAGYVSPARTLRFNINHWYRCYVNTQATRDM